MTALGTLQRSFPPCAQPNGPSIIYSIIIMVVILYCNLFVNMNDNITITSLRFSFLLQVTGSTNTRPRQYWYTLLIVEYIS